MCVGVQGMCMWVSCVMPHTTTCIHTDIHMHTSIHTAPQTGTFQGCNIVGGEMLCLMGGSEGGREGELHEANVVGVQPSHGSSYHIYERSVNLVSLSLRPLV